MCVLNRQILFPPIFLAIQWLSRISEKLDFVEKTFFMDGYLCPIMCATPQNFANKTFAHGQKIHEIPKVLPSKVSHYMVSH